MVGQELEGGDQLKRDLQRGQSQHHQPLLVGMEGHKCTVKLLCPMGRGNSKEKKLRRLRSGSESGEGEEKNSKLVHPPLKERDTESQTEKELGSLKVSVSFLISSLDAIPNFHADLMEL
jgi:hypothetical protein